MTENNKPEWFEIADSDGPSSPAKVRRSLPIAAFIAAALIIGVGAVVAQTQEESPANATESTSVSSQQAVAPSTAPAATQVKTPTVNVTPSASATPSNTTLANPNIAKLPSGGDREGDDGDHEGREHHGDRFRHPEGDND